MNQSHINSWGAGYIERCMSGSMGDSQKPSVVIQKGVGFLPYNFNSTFKMLLYMTYVWSDYVLENDKKREIEIKTKGSSKIKASTSKGFKLPPVLPIVYHDGPNKWTSSMNLIDRIELADIFEKYIPKFEYELVNLNEYSREDLISFGNLLSLVMITDKVHKEEDMDLLTTLPEDYLEKLTLNVPKHLLKLLEKCLRVFLTKAGVDKEQIDEITEKLYKRRFADMFDVQFSIKDIKKKAKIEGIEEGIEKGIEKGKKEGIIETAKNFLKKGVSVEVVSDCTGLDEDFLEKLKQLDV